MNYVACSRLFPNLKWQETERQWALQIVINSSLTTSIFFQCTLAYTWGENHFKEPLCTSACFEYLGTEAPWREDEHLLLLKDLTLSETQINVKASLEQILQPSSVVNKRTEEVGTAGAYLYVNTPASSCQATAWGLFC